MTNNSSKDYLQELNDRLQASRVGKSCHYFAAAAAGNGCVVKPTLARKERARRNKLKKISKQSKRRNRV